MSNKLISTNINNIKRLRFTSHILHMDCDNERDIVFNMKTHVFQGKDIACEIKKLMFRFNVEDDIIMRCSSRSTQWYCLYKRDFKNIKIELKDGTIISDITSDIGVALGILNDLLYNIATTIK